MNFSVDGTGEKNKFRDSYHIQKPILDSPKKKKNFKKIIKSIFPLCQTKKHEMSICFILGDANFLSLGKYWCPPKHCIRKISYFFLRIKKKTIIAKQLCVLCKLLQIEGTFCLPTIYCPSSGNRMLLEKLPHQMLFLVELTLPSLLGMGYPNMISLWPTVIS